MSLCSLLICPYLSDVRNIKDQQLMILAKYHILDKDNSDLQCSICFQTHFQLLQCKGPCQKQYCVLCARRFNYRQCPFCLEPCKVDYIPLKKTKFGCPSQCQAILQNERQFYQHCLSCPSIPNELKQHYNFKDDYKCNKGHRLRFPLYKTNCSICLQYHYTSNCSNCDVRLCTFCRPPPCSRQQCPLGHNFEKNSLGGSVICDLCGISLSMMFTKEVYGDRACNFDVCLRCYQKLPQEHPMPDYRNDQVLKKDQEEVRGSLISRRPLLPQGLERAPFIDNDSSSSEEEKAQQGETENQQHVEWKPQVEKVEQKRQDNNEDSNFE